MNRYPQVLARQVATLADLAPGRVELGIGIGGHPAEHLAYGIPLPEPCRSAPRAWRRRCAVLRALFSGGPVTRPSPFYPLGGGARVPGAVARAAHHRSRARRPRARGSAPARRRMDLLRGDVRRLHPVFLEALAAAGVAARTWRCWCRWTCRSTDAAADPLLADLAGSAAAWAERGADELVLHWVRPPQLDAVIAAAERAELRSR